MSVGHTRSAIKCLTDKGLIHPDCLHGKPCSLYRYAAALLMYMYMDPSILASNVSIGVLQ